MDGTEATIDVQTMRTFCRDHDSRHHEFWIIGNVLTAPHDTILNALNISLCSQVNRQHSHDTLRTATY